ncbi:hypothetical protein Tco_1295345 [Tanacetum coccineum]
MCGTYARKSEQPSKRAMEQMIFTNQYPSSEHNLRLLGCALCELQFGIVLLYAYLELSLLRGKDQQFLVTGVQKGLAVCLVELIVGGSRDLLTQKHMHWKKFIVRGRKKIQLCCDGAIVYAEGETLCSWKRAELYII